MWLELSIISYYCHFVADKIANVLFLPPNFLSLSVLQTFCCSKNKLELNEELANDSPFTSNHTDVLKPNGFHKLSTSYSNAVNDYVSSIMLSKQKHCQSIESVTFRL